MVGLWGLGSDSLGPKGPVAPEQCLCPLNPLPPHLAHSHSPQEPFRRPTPDPSLGPVPTDMPRISQVCGCVCGCLCMIVCM